MLRLLFDQTPIPFTIHDPSIAYLSANGVIENVNGSILYKGQKYLIETKVYTDRSYFE